MGLYVQETAVVNVATILRTYLAAELALIDTEKPDSIVLDVPTSSQITIGAVGPSSLNDTNLLVEVYSDDARPHEPRGEEITLRRLSEDVVTTVRVTIADRGMEGAESLFLRSARTIAAIIRVLSYRYWTLGGTVESCRQIAIRARNLPGDMLVRQAEVTFNVLVVEVHA